MLSWLLLKLSWVSFAATPLPLPCLTFASAVLVDPAERQLTVDGLSRYSRPVVVAHGKNDNVAMESTWANLRHSLLSGANVLEVDLHMTRDGHFVLVHDPTFHALAADYRTPPERVEAFRRSHPALFERKQHDWDFGLVARVDSYTLGEIQETVRLRDRRQNHDVDVITLDQLLAASATPGRFVIPPHTVRPIGGEARPVGEEAIVTGRNPILYLDVKDINTLARRLSGLSSWDWIRESLSLTELRALTRRTLENLSRALTAQSAHDRVFITVRHEEVARMAREVDPRIRIMVSPDSVTENTSTPELVRAIEAFGAQRPELVEVKYLRHILDPEFRRIARERGWKLFYNQIVQTDPSQFEGRYRNNLPLLLNDIFALGRDIVIQTNTVGEVRSHVDSIP